MFWIGGMSGPVSYLLSMAVYIYVLVVILEVCLHWLIALEIVNEKNEAAKNLNELLKRFTEPAYKHLRKYVPPINGIDMSPLVLIIGVELIGGIIISLIPF